LLQFFKFKREKYLTFLVINNYFHSIAKIIDTIIIKIKVINLSYKFEFSNVEIYKVSSKINAILTGNIIQKYILLLIFLNVIFTIYEVIHDYFSLDFLANIKTSEDARIVIRSITFVLIISS
jgi:hypothetical protein